MRSRSRGNSTLCDVSSMLHRSARYPAIEVLCRIVPWKSRHTPPGAGPGIRRPGNNRIRIVRALLRKPPLLNIRGNRLPATLLRGGHDAVHLGARQAKLPGDRRRLEAGFERRQDQPLLPGRHRSGAFRAFPLRPSFHPACHACAPLRRPPPEAGPAERRRDSVARGPGPRAGQASPAGCRRLRRRKPSRPTGPHHAFPVRHRTGRISPYVAPSPSSIRSPVKPSRAGPAGCRRRHAAPPITAQIFRWWPQRWSLLQPPPPARAAGPPSAASLHRRHAQRRREGSRAVSGTAVGWPGGGPRRRSRQSA